MKVRDVMTRASIKYCSPRTKLHNAAKTMKSENCDALSVVDENKNVIGIITDRDIALSLAKKDSLPPAKRNVSEIMSRTHAVNPEDDLSSALHRMRTNQAGRLPVVDEQGKLEGIISLQDILSGYEKKEGREFENISLGSETSAKAALSDRHSQQKKTKARMKTAL